MRSTYRFPQINQALQQYASVVSRLTATSIDHEFMEQVSALLRKHPAIIAHIDEIVQGVEQLKSSCWKNFLSELRTQLNKHGISFEAEPHEDKAGWVIYFFSGTSPHACLEDGSQIPMALMWDRGAKALTIGAGLHRSLNRSEIWESNRSRFASLNSRLHQEGFSSWEAGEWWPLGLTTVIEGFMTNEFVANNTSEDDQALHKRALVAAETIKTYLETVKSA